MCTPGGWQKKRMWRSPPSSTSWTRPSGRAGGRRKGTGAPPFGRRRGRAHQCAVQPGRPKRRWASRCRAAARGGDPQNPDYIRLAAPRVSGRHVSGRGPGPGTPPFYARKAQRGEYLDLSALSEELPEETVSLISRVLAELRHQAERSRPGELYLDRIEHSQPVSSTAGGRTARRACGLPAGFKG